MPPFDSAQESVLYMIPLHYASICSYASTLLLCSKLCGIIRQGLVYMYILEWSIILATHNTQLLLRLVSSDALVHL